MANGWLLFGPHDPRRETFDVDGDRDRRPRAAGYKAGRAGAAGRAVLDRLFDDAVGTTHYRPVPWEPS